MFIPILCAANTSAPRRIGAATHAVARNPIRAAIFSREELDAIRQMDFHAAGANRIRSFRISGILT